LSVGSCLNTKFDFAMDWDLLLRFSNNNLNIKHLNVFLGLFRIHKSSKTIRQFNTIGITEMNQIRLNELGFVPNRYQLFLKVIPFLLISRLYELIHSFCDKKLSLCR
jgi:hypothetical protein